MRRMLFWFLLIVGLAFAAPLGAADAPGFEPGPCLFSMPRGVSVTCGFLTVPEARGPAQADPTRTIRIAAAVFHSSSDTPLPDPIIYLDGGPGGHTLRFAGFEIDNYRPFLESRDVIFFDQRGVGFSQPNLTCPEGDRIRYDLLSAPTDDVALMREFDAIYSACRDNYIAQGIQITAYNSAENAADVRDLLTALGYEQANLFGVSYGTRLALTIMRDHPQIVRSAVLDSVYPPDVNLFNELAPNMDRAFNTLFDGCAAIPACAERYPDLREVFFETVDRLNAEPELVSFFDSYTATPRDILVTGDILVDGLFGLLYRTDVIPTLPQIIYEAQAGRYDAFLDDLVFELFTGQFFSATLYDAVLCYEEMPLATFEQALTLAQDLPIQIADLLLPQVEDYHRFCDAWADTSADPIEDAPVTSDLPALVLAGEYDPITPPEWGQRAAATLTRSFFYQFPGLGHGVVSSDACAAGIMATFIDDPTREPEADCIARMGPPVFFAGAIRTVMTEPYRSDLLGFEGIAPVGWVEIEPGNFTPYVGDSLPAMAYRFPETLHAYIERIIYGEVYRYTALPDPTAIIDTRAANGLLWTIYAITSPDGRFYSHFAFSQGDGGRPYVVAIVARDPAESAALYDGLLLLALDAFRP